MPSPLPTTSREYRIYLAIWRKVYLTGEEIELTASNFSLALNMRQGFYRAIRPYRDGTLLDEELAKAAETYVVSVIKGPDKSAPHKVTIKARRSLSELEAAIEFLGLSEEDLLLASEQKTLSDLEALTSSDLPRRSTPFYER